MDDFLCGLNEMQKEAVLTTEGPVLVLAGAGSGKTKTLTHRLAYMIKEKNISPFNILAVTFTNKAANEMEERIFSLLGARTRLPWLGTFHSVCVRILRHEAEILGYKKSFTIYDETDRLSAIKHQMKKLKIDPSHFKPSVIAWAISGAKNELIDPINYQKYTHSPLEKNVLRVYQEYQKYLKGANAFDFDDLIMMTVKLFTDNPKILKKYQDIFRYILIDEYQDTNHAQYRLIKLLAQKRQNIMVVGDDYQSIYSFRGANFKNILNFEKDYKGTKVIKLEQNYRSTKTILAAANDVIKFNKQKKDKKLWTENKEGFKISLFEAKDEREEAEFVAMEIKSHVLAGKCQYRDCAVLYRTNAQSRAVEEAFLTAKMPYRVVGGLRFYERREIKDILALLRFILNIYDFEALKRVAKSMPLGLGQKTLEKIISFLEEEGQSNLLSLDKCLPKIKEDFSAKVLAFFETLALLQQQFQSKSLSGFILEAAEKSGYKRFLLDGTPEGEGRWENVLELVTVAEQSETSLLEINILASREEVLQSFLEQVALNQDTDELLEDHGAVTLMTLHSAKGLEFKIVFIVGVEDGLFPHSRALYDDFEMEEERRLCYVGITRAKEKLYFLYARERNLYGQTNFNSRSRFIEAINEDLLYEI